MPSINVADLRDPSDPRGRSYRQVNAERAHAIPVGALVELRSGARAFVVGHDRDCDQTPLYAVSLGRDDATSSWSRGWPEASLRRVDLA